MKQEIAEVGQHPKYGTIYGRGEGIGCQYFVQVDAQGGMRGGEYTLCYLCKNPIIDELGQQIYPGICDASAHLECVFERRLKFGPIKPENVIFYRGSISKQSNLLVQYIQLRGDVNNEI